MQPDFDVRINGRPLGPDVKQAISRLNYEESVKSGEASTVHLTISEMGAADFDVRIEDRLQLDIGYTGHLQPVFIGSVISMSLSCTDRESEVEVECHDLSYLLKPDACPETVISASAEGGWYSIVRQIVKTFGLRIAVPERNHRLRTALTDDQSVIYGGVKEQTEPIYRTTSGTMYRTTFEPGDTPWECLKKIADKLNLVLFVRGDVVFLEDIDWLAHNQQQQLTLVYNPTGDDDGRANMLPLVEFTPSTSLAGNANAIETQSFTPDEISDEPLRDGVINALENVTPDLAAFVEPRTDTYGDIITAQQLQLRDSQPGIRSTDDATAGLNEMWASFLGWITPVAANLLLEFGLIQDRPPQLSEESREYLDNLKLDIDFRQPISHPADTFAGIETETRLQLAHAGANKQSAGDANSTALQALYAAEARLNQMIERLTEARGEVPWAPILRAGHKHQIILNALGTLGKDYSGEYRVTAVRHVITSRSFKTDFDMSRPYFRTPAAKGEVRI